MTESKSDKKTKLYMHLFERRSLKQSHYVNYHMKIAWSCRLVFRITYSLSLLCLKTFIICQLDIYQNCWQYAKRKNWEKNHLLFLASIEGFSQIQHQHFQKKYFVSTRVFPITEREGSGGSHPSLPANTGFSPPPKICINC